MSSPKLMNLIWEFFLSMPTLSFINTKLMVLVLAAFLGACAGPGTSVQAPQHSPQQARLTDARLSSGGNVSSVNTATLDVPAEEVTTSDVDDQAIEVNSDDETGPLTERVREERETAFNPYVLTAHKHNFVLPVSYSSGINEEIYRQNDVPLREGLQPAEVKFQISLKTRLNEADLMFPDDAFSLGITLKAWWQLYSSDLSSPFRETNYQPEAFYLVPLKWGPFGGNTAIVAGFEHQSNGQVQGLSRSWNRLYTMLIYEKGGFVGSLRPWYRIPEKSKETPDAPEGDDNPDIIDFMGYGELNVSWRNEKYEYAAMGRGNPETGKGALKIGVTFPLFAKFRGFVQFFSGYGDSLIDYDHYQQRIGLGVALTNLF